MLEILQVGYSGQASWNIEEDLLDYQPPDGLELSVVCQGAGAPHRNRELDDDDDSHHVQCRTLYR